MGLSVNNAHLLVLSRLTTICFKTVKIRYITQASVILWAVNILLSGFVPYTQEDTLQFIYRIAFDATVHIVPFTHLISTFNIIVGNVHTARICHASVNDNYLTMVARPNMIDEWKANRVELVYLNSQCSDSCNIFLSHRAVVRHIAESIVQEPHLNTFFNLWRKVRYQFTVDGIVTKVEVFHVNGTASLVNRFKKVVKFLLSRHQQGY